MTWPIELKMIKLNMRVGGIRIYTSEVTNWRPVQGQDQASSNFFPHTIFKNTLNFLPMLKHCEISYKTWISRVSTKMGSSKLVLQLYVHKVTSRQSWAEAAVPTGWSLSPSMCAVPTALCGQHLSSCNHFSIMCGGGGMAEFSSSLIQNLSLRFMIYTLSESLKSCSF